MELIQHLLGQRTNTSRKGHVPKVRSVALRESRNERHSLPEKTKAQMQQGYGSARNKGNAPHGVGAHSHHDCVTTAETAGAFYSRICYSHKESVACVTPTLCFHFRVKVTGLTRVLQHISKRKNHHRDSVISVDLANSLIAIWDNFC